MIASVGMCSPRSTLPMCGALDAGEVRQRLLRDAALRPQRAPPRRRLRQLGVVGGGAGRSAALDGSLLHGQKRQVAAQLKPRYL
jgi:hypothetical protein